MLQGRTLWELVEKRARETPMPMCRGRARCGADVRGI